MALSSTSTVLHWESENRDEMTGQGSSQMSMGEAQPMGVVCVHSMVFVKLRLFLEGKKRKKLAVVVSCP